MFEYLFAPLYINYFSQLLVKKKRKKKRKEQETEVHMMQLLGASIVRRIATDIHLKVAIRRWQRGRVGTQWPRNDRS